MPNRNDEPSGEDSMASPVRIEIENSTVLPGESTQAKVFVTIEKSTRVRNITARFYGYEEVEATVTERDSDGDSKTVTRTERTTIVDETFLLLGDERKGFFGRLADSASTIMGGGDHEVLEPGEYEYTVDLAVPESATASGKSDLFRVEYSLQASVDLPIKIDWSAKETITVPLPEARFEDSQPAHTTFPDASGRSLWQKTFGKEVTLNLALDRDRMVAGQRVTGMLTIESPEPLNIKKVVVRLAGTETSNVRGDRDSRAWNDMLCEIDAPTVMADRSVHEFDFVVPESKKPFSHIGLNFEVRWSIEAQIYIPWAADPVIRVPVLVAAAPA